MEPDITKRVNNLTDQAMELGFGMGSLTLKTRLLSRLQPYLEYVDNDLLTPRALINMVLDEINEFDAKTEYKNYGKGDAQ